MQVQVLSCFFYVMLDVLFKYKFYINLLSMLISAENTGGSKLLF
jgi:hypothetical protein